MNEVYSRARQSGFEFKLLKGQCNKAYIELWACIRDEHSSRPAPKKIEQLTH